MKFFPEHRVKRERELGKERGWTQLFEEASGVEMSKEGFGYGFGVCG